MKKSSFVAMVLGTISGALFALGMCMTLVSEWNAFMPGILFGGAGLLLALVTWIVWRKMEHKKPIQISRKAICISIVGIWGVLAFGIGMCFCLIGNRMTAGILIGLAGIVLLLCLIPLAKGIKE